MSQLVLMGSLVNNVDTLPLVMTTDVIEWKIIGQWSLMASQERHLITLPATALIQLEFSDGWIQYLSVAEAQKRYQLDFTTAPASIITLCVLQIQSTSTTAPLTALLHLEQQYARGGLYQLATHPPFTAKPINSAPLI